MFRRRGRPGLLGTVARTAVVAGTATATAGAVSRHSANKAAEKEAASEQQSAQQQADTQQAAQQAAAEQAAANQPAPPAAAGGDLIGELTKLGQLKDAGVLSEAEFTAAKAKLLG
jgi:Short C-terminal domain